MVRNRMLESVESLPVDTEKVSAYFRQIEDLTEEVNALATRKMILESRAYSLPSPSANMNARVQVSLRDSGLHESYVDAKEDLNAELQARSNELESLKRQAERIIRDHFHGKERMVLILHYIDGETWKATAQACNYSERHIYRLGKEMLSRITLPDDAIWV